MPQLDKITFFSQISTFLFIFFIFYFITLRIVLPSVLQSIRVHKLKFNNVNKFAIKILFQKFVFYKLIIQYNFFFLKSFNNIFIDFFVSGFNFSIRSLYSIYFKFVNFKKLYFYKNLLFVK